MWEGCSGIQFPNQHYATPALHGNVYGFHIFKSKPWLCFFILNIPNLKAIIARSPISYSWRNLLPSKQIKSLKKKKKKSLSLISKLKQDMRINTASHSHLELLLKMGMDLEKYSESVLFCACLQPLQRMLYFCFCFFKEC